MGGIKKKKKEKSGGEQKRELSKRVKTASKEIAHEI